MTYDLKNKNLLKKDIKYVLFSEIYDKFSEPKTKRKAFLILENTVGLIDKRGFENITFIMIARESGISTPTLRYYFKNIEEIKDLAIKYVYTVAQKIVITHMKPAKSSEERLRLYLEGHYLWVYNAKVYYRVWLNFVSNSARNKKFKEMNTRATLVGTDRIVDMLSSGRSASKLSDEEIYIKARFLQTFILGWLSACTSQEIVDTRKFSEQMISECLKLFDWL